MVIGVGPSAASAIALLTGCLLSGLGINGGTTPASCIPFRMTNTFTSLVISSAPWEPFGPSTSTWILAAHAQGNTFMVQVVISISSDYVLRLYASSAGLVSGLIGMSESSINAAWNSRVPAGVPATCNTCPGFGVASLQIENDASFPATTSGNRSGGVCFDCCSPAQIHLLQVLRCSLGATTLPP